MGYRKEVEKLLKNLSQKERAAFVDRFGIDLSEPELMLQSQHIFNETRKRIREIERKALRKLNPEQVIPEPGGPECSFCGNSENEVKMMAKHESGFNICNECVELCLEIIREESND